MHKRGEILYNIKQRNTQFYCFLIIFLLLIIVQTPSTHALGVSTPYLVNDTIRLEPGQKYNYTINIQNGDNTLLDVDFKYSSDRDIAKLQERNFTMLPLTYENPFTFDIQIPENSIPGEVYTLTFSAKPIINQEGQVPMNIEIKRKLTIQIVKQGGQGYKLTTWNKFKIWVARQKISRETIIIIIISIITILALLFAIMRIWHVSQNISVKLSKTKTLIHAKKTIDECVSIEDIREFIELIPKEAFHLIEVREIIAKQCEKINERFIAQRIRTIESKKKCLALLKT